MGSHDAHSVPTEVSPCCSLGDLVEADPPLNDPLQANGEHGAPAAHDDDRGICGRHGDDEFVVDGAGEPEGGHGSLGAEEPCGAGRTAGQQRLSPSSLQWGVPSRGGAGEGAQGIGVGGHFGERNPNCGQWRSDDRCLGAWWRVQRASRSHHPCFLYFDRDRTWVTSNGLRSAGGATGPS